MFDAADAGSICLQGGAASTSLYHFDSSLPPHSPDELSLDASHDRGQNSVPSPPKLAKVRAGQPLSRRVQSYYQHPRIEAIHGCSAGPVTLRMGGAGLGQGCFGGNTAWTDGGCCCWRMQPSGAEARQPIFCGGSHSSLPLFRVSKNKMPSCRWCRRRCSAVDFIWKAQPCKSGHPQGMIIAWSLSHISIWIPSWLWKLSPDGRKKKDESAG